MKRESEDYLIDWGQTEASAWRSLSIFTTHQYSLEIWLRFSSFRPKDP